MLDINDLIGTRFLDHGRSKDTGFDCYGYVIEVARRHGHTLPDFWYKKTDGDTFDRNAKATLPTLSDLWVQTDRQEEGNVIIFLEGGKLVHIGIIVEEDLFTHCDKYGVRIQRLSEYYRTSWKIYRWL